MNQNGLAAERDLAPATELSTAWYLHGYIDEEQIPRRIAISSVPFRIGRASGLEAHLPVHHVSEIHAEIYLDGEDLWLRDNSSRNGTFLNRKRLTEAARLRDGDVIHFSTNEFVLRRGTEASQELAQTKLLAASDFDLPEHFVGGVPALQELIDKKQVLPHYQPLVRLSDARELIGYEVRGRGGHAGLPVEAGPLFELAESAGLEVLLSRLFRQKGLYLAQVLPQSQKMFVKIHRSEVASTRLLESLQVIRKAIPDTAIVLEIHEAAVLNAQAMSEFREALSAMNIELAYDKFGAGEARLVELIEVPPDYIKFDISLVRDIDQAPVIRQKMLETLVAIVNDLGVVSIAKGLETEAEFRICRELGFRCGQGNVVGLPVPVHSLLNPIQRTNAQAD